MIKKVYSIENIDCANCAAKIEALINKMPEVEEATITFATKQLRVTAENPDGLIPQITELANRVENGVVISEFVRASRKKRLADTDCGHGHSTTDCGCGHGHSTTDCGCGHENAHRTITDLHCLLVGTPLFLTGVALSQLGNKEISLGAFLCAYAVLGGQILMTAIKNIGKGRVFDENFLMSIATIGAICIQEYPEAVGVMLFFRIGQYFEERAVAKSRSQIMEVIDLRPETVNLITASGDIKLIPAEEAEVADVVLVRPGERIPLDGQVVSGESRIDTAPITGEPVPIRVTEGSKVMSGSINTSGVLKIKVEKPLEESMVTRILNSVENAAASKPKIDRFITKFARVYTPFVVALALGTAIIPSVITGDWERWIYTALTFLVISCPCALVLSVPLAFFSGIGAGSKKGILFKGGVVIEALKHIKVVVLDKTGTITEGNFKVQNVICTGELFKHFSKQGLAGVSKADVEKYLLYLAACCEKNSTHPIGVSILEMAERFGIEPTEPEKVKEISGKGIVAYLPIGRILCGNRKLLEDFHVNVGEYKNPKAGTEVLLAIDKDFVGALLIADNIKEDSKRAINHIKKMGISTVILTGDGEANAYAVAKQIGVEKVFAKLLPEDKLRILREIRTEKGAVMFVGDGINDAPVLAGADVGAAMGNGTEAAMEAADVVFMTSNLQAVPEALSIAKKTGNIAVQNIVFALVVKAVVMVLGLAGMASMWMAVFADTGVAMLCVLNSIKLINSK